MGNPKASEKDQYAVAKITISHDGKSLSERKINFAKNGMEIVGETLKLK